jgi:hypothetical protein
LSRCIPRAKPGIERKPSHQVASFLHADVVRSDRRLAQPLLQSRNCLVMLLLDLPVNGFEIGGVCHRSG